MKRFVACLFLVAVTQFGCAQNYFNIPADNVVEKVKALGIAPIFVDADSDITYPQKELLLPLIADLNRKSEPFLLRKLQSTGSFLAVTQLADEPQQLFSKLIARREKRDDADIKYNKYFWKNDEISTYIKNNRLDALMVVVVSGLTKSSKIYSGNLLTSLETNYNFLTMTAQIIAPDGTILWEYPNFRARLLTYYPLVNLQYPDFSESEANLSRKTELRFKSIDGIRRTLEQKKNDWKFQETAEPEVYGRLFDEIASLVVHSGKKPEVNPADVKPAAPQDPAVKPAGEAAQPPAPAPQAAKPAPAAEAPPQAPAPAVPVSAPDAPNDIVPATGTTR